MDHPTWLLVTGVFVVIWLLIPAIILHYRLTSVVHRYNEVLDAFFGWGVSEDEKNPVPSEDIERIPAWHYIKARRPIEAADMREEQISYADLIRPIHEQFRRLHGPERYAFPFILVALFSGVDLVACHSWVMGQISSVPVLFPGLPPYVAAALAGAYVWSLYEIINRRNTRDLTSDELYPIAFRLATAVPIGIALAQLLANDRTYTAVAFAATAFPFRDVNRLIRQKVIKGDLRDPVSSDARRFRGYLAETLQGFSPDTVVRLEELNIATVLDMAYADPVYLMLKTGTPIRQVITWLDGSLLATYAGPRTASFAKLGLPCSIDISDIWRRFKRGAPESANYLKALAASLDMKQPVLEDLLRRVEMDPQVRFIFSVWQVVVSAETVTSDGAPSGHVPDKSS